MPRAFFNSSFVDQAAAGLPLTDLGFTRGFGIFEAIRTYNRTPFELDAHLGRMAAAAAQLGLDLPLSLTRIATILAELSATNVPSGEVSFKLYLTGGSADGLRPTGPATFLALAEPLTPLPEAWYRDGIALITDTFQRDLPEVKSLNYLHAVQLQAKRLAAGAEEILYLADGELRECSTSNIFLVHGKTLSTPSDHVLPGVTRSTVSQLAASEYTVSFRPIPQTEIESADEVFITATRKEVLPVTHIDGRPVGKGGVGPVARALRARYLAYANQMTQPQ